MLAYAAENNQTAAGDGRFGRQQERCPEVKKGSEGASFRLIEPFDTKEHWGSTGQSADNH